MRRKRKSFTLLEVLVAITLATGCIFYLLDFQNGQVRKQRESLEAFTLKDKLQEASVIFYEQLYLNQIDWKIIESERSFVFPLDSKKWQAIAKFKLLNPTEVVLADQLHASAQITLLHNEVEKTSPTTTLYFFCVKNAET